MSIEKNNPSRRDFLRSGLVLGGATTAAVVAGSIAIPSADATAASQSNWRFCTACACLKYTNGTSFDDGDICNSNADENLHNGVHNAGSANYSLFTTASQVNGQAGWRYCYQCSELVWPPTPSSTGSNGYCPADGGEHLLRGDTYVVQTTANVAPGTRGWQSGWRYCYQCGVLVWPAAFYSGRYQCAYLDSEGHRTRGDTYSLRLT